MDGHANTGGIFGFSTAGHWWGRPAAKRTWLAHYALGRELVGRIRIYVDDGQLRSQQERSGGLPRPRGLSLRGAGLRPEGAQDQGRGRVSVEWPLAPAFHVQTWHPRQEAR